jgi:hypothetical protein
MDLHKYRDAGLKIKRDNSLYRPASASANLCAFTMWEPDAQLFASAPWILAAAIAGWHWTVCPIFSRGAGLHELANAAESNL